MQDHEISKSDLEFIINEAIKAVSKMIEVIIQENYLIENMRIDEIAALQDQKTQLTDEISQYKVYISQAKNLHNNIDQELRVRLLELSQKLDQATEENYQKLTSAITVNSKIMEIITSVVLEHQKANAIYDKNGHYDPNATKQLKITTASTENII